MTTIGNHERNWPHSGDRFPAQYDSGGECGVPYERRLQMPRPAEDKPWYSFDFGPIHFLQYSTEHVFAKGKLFLLLTQQPYVGSANGVHVDANHARLVGEILQCNAEHVFANCSLTHWKAMCSHPEWMGD